MKSCVIVGSKYKKLLYAITGTIVLQNYDKIVPISYKQF